MRMLVGLALGFACAVTLVHPASAAPLDGTACALTGRATFAPPLTTTPHDTTVGFSGTVSSCQGSPVSSGDIDAIGSGVLSCLGGDGGGVATLTWSDGSKSVIDFAASVRTPFISINGTVFSGNRFVDEQAQALLVGDVADPGLAFLSAPSCRNAVGGIASAPFRGAVQIGETS
ncbi:MAG: hypothetical protein ABR548_03580 [Actinomycetota bacterium]|nr:hypothetical protein [Actinomycetota bacterium]